MTIPQTTSWDPTVFERTAKALREMDLSPNSLQALKLAQLSEQTKQIQLSKDTEKARLQAEELASKRVEAEASHQRRLLALKLNNEKDAVKYKAHIEKKAVIEREAEQARIRRIERENDGRQHAAKERVRLQTEKEILQMRLGTIIKEKESEEKKDLAKIREEYACKTKLERTNRDIRMAELNHKLQFKSELSLQRLKYTVDSLESGINRFFSDRKTRTVAFSAFAAISGVYFGMSRGSNVALEILRNKIGYPSLIRHTSKSMWPRFLIPRRIIPVDRLVISQANGRRLDTLARSLKATSQGKIAALGRNFLFHGPPGTGKTSFAIQLANEAGLDYAVCTGGDFLSIRDRGPVELNKVFDWAQRSRRGVLLFIDEAEAFLKAGRAEINGMSEHLRATLATFLNRAGASSCERVNVVLSTNEPSILDEAVLDRVDETIEFSLPTEEERIEIIKLRLNELFNNGRVQRWWWSNKNPRIHLRDLEQVSELLSRDTAGLSGRQITKLVNSFHVYVVVYSMGYADCEVARNFLAEKNGN